jgi:hypothetical protein
VVFTQLYQNYAYQAQLDGHHVKNSNSEYKGIFHQQRRNDPSRQQPTTAVNGYTNGSPRPDDNHHVVLAASVPLAAGVSQTTTLANSNT